MDLVATEQRIREAAGTWSHWPRSPRLTTLAKLIKERWPELHVVVEEWSVTPDKRSRGCRYRIDGVRREGKRLRVHEGGALGRVIFSHATAETYRENRDVCRWIVERLVKGE